MGGNVHVNFGPHFVYPIQTSQLSTVIKKLCPMSDLCQTPKSPEDITEWTKKEEKEKAVPKWERGSTASSVNASEVGGDRWKN